MEFFKNSICLTDFFSEWVTNHQLLGIYIIDETQAQEIKRCCDNLGIPFSMENYDHAKNTFGVTETIFANNHTWLSFDTFCNEIGCDFILSYSWITDPYDIYKITETEHKLLKKLNPELRLSDIKLLNIPNVKLFSTINHDVKIGYILNNYVLIEDKM